MWVHDPDRLDVTLDRHGRRASASAASCSRRRDAVRVQIDQAAGIVIALLVAFSLVALGRRW